ncbi:pyridoxal phosphate-dependent aminotransferase [Streptomyces sp. NPDC049590]|uniref:pyridoxal phosphate-dependent aminotransferase n=1 Tax=Streptomyces sp. NPDC049590 TaxID=3154834 RepID=UPI00341F394A
MSPRVAQRFSHIERSATFSLRETVQRLRADGVRVVDLGGGEPDFDTPPHISAAAARALSEGRTHYTPSQGLPELLRAVAAKLARDNGVTVDPAEGVVVTPSAKHALFVALTTVLDPGDEVIVPTPAWVSYPAMASLAGARAVPAALRGEDGFRLTRDLLESCVSARTRAVLVNTPGNPTGRVLTRQEAEDVRAFAEHHDLVVISDEIYEKITFDGRAPVSVAALPGAAGRTLTVNGFSKGYAMTGWRLGYLAGPAPLISQALKVQEHTVSCASSFAQYGALAALTGPQDAVRAMTGEYQRRRDAVVAGLNALPGVRCPRPEGAFYAFADIRETGLSSAGFSRWLLTEAGVALAPGTAFGAAGEGHVRLSFAAPAALLEEAVERMAAALPRLRRR